jgi:PIN domain nuclease of toxin-antitoxin system
VKVLLDTRVFLLWMRASDRLSDELRDILGDPTTQPYLSAVSCWELSMKKGLGRLDFGTDTRTFITEASTRHRIQHLPIQPRHAAFVGELPWHHKDPFDRMLIAQAMLEKMPIVTSDAAFRRYPVEVIWK